MQYQTEILIPIFGMLTGIIIPVSVFIWLYYEGKGKRETVLEISKNLDNSDKIEELLKIFEERKKEPIDYRRNGVITIFVGLGLYLFGYLAIGQILKGVGALVCLIGIGTLIAGYLYPNTGKELTDAVDDFEKKQVLGKNHKKLINNLQEFRKSANLTQQDLSVAAEVSRKSINAIENGIYVPSTVLALKIAKTLGCKVEDLFDLP